MNPATVDLHAHLALAIRATDNLQCTGPTAPHKSCLSAHEGDRDKQGRALLFFGEGCTLVESFCPSCRAYWHLQVARNAVDVVDRVTAIAARGQSVAQAPPIKLDTPPTQADLDSYSAKLLRDVCDRASAEHASSAAAVPFVKVPAALVREAREHLKLSK